MLSDTDCDLRVHDSMDGASNAIGHVERAGAVDLGGVHDRTGIVFCWLKRVGRKFTLQPTVGVSGGAVAADLRVWTWYYLQPPSCRRRPARFNFHCFVSSIRRIRAHLQRVELPLELCKGVSGGTVRANDVERH